MFTQQFANNIRTLTNGTATVYEDDFVLNCDTTSGAITIPLMAIVTPWSSTYKLLIVDSGNNSATNNITITVPAGFKINGASTMTVSSNGASVLVSISNNTNYIGISSAATGNSNALTQIPVKNTVYVMKNGNDSTGLVERFDKPFLTIAAARTAALVAFTSRTDTARVNVIVESGYYEENLILDKFIDYSLNDCVINGGVTDNNVDFGASGANVWTNIISGQAKIYNQHSSGIVTGLLIYRSNTKLLMYCDTIATTNDDCIAIINGRVRIYANRIYTESTVGNYMFAVEMAQGFGGSSFTVESIVDIIGAQIYNTSSSIASVISFETGGVSKNQTLNLFNCTVSALNNPPAGNKDRSAIGCGESQSSNGKLNLYNCILYSAFGNSIHVNTPNTLNVYYYHSNMANAVTGGAGTLTNALTTTLTVNAAVQSGF